MIGEVVEVSCGKVYRLVVEFPSQEQILFEFYRPLNFKKGDKVDVIPTGDGYEIIKKSVG